MDVSIGHTTVIKLEVAVVVIKGEKSPPLLFQVKSELLTSISSVSGSIKMEIFQINDHINKRTTPQVQIT